MDPIPAAIEGPRIAMGIIRIAIGTSQNAFGIARVAIGTVPIAMGIISIARGVGSHASRRAATGGFLGPFTLHVYRAAAVLVPASFIAAI